jgi:hypothetical protein
MPYQSRIDSGFIGCNSSFPEGRLAGGHCRGRQSKLIPLTPGRDFGDAIEIVAGLQGNESVISNPPDSITTGEKVQIAQATATGGTR